MAKNMVYLKKLKLKKEKEEMFIILNWWCDETIADAQVVCKDDGSGENAVFETEEEANNYAEENLNGYWKVVEE